MRRRADRERLDAGALDLGALVGEPRPPSVDYQTAPTPDPGDQPNMPDAETAAVRPASDGPEKVDVDAIRRTGASRRLDVLPARLAVDGWGPEGGVAAVMVVEVEPAVKGVGALACSRCRART